MAFNSIAFLVLAAAFFAAWPIVRHGRAARLWAILAASCVFYGWWDWRFLPLMLGTGLLDWCLALAMDRAGATARRALLVASLATNLGMLAFFKYAMWGLDQASALAASLGVVLPEAALEVTLPVGISFYTFQSLSYTIDVYRRRMPAVRDPVLFLAYLSLFPQLVAGPIERACDLLPQLETPGEDSAQARWDGLLLVVRGFLRKCIVADHLAPVVNAAFSGGIGPLGGPAWWIAGALFGLQIYADFAGYSDIARGLARMMGYGFSVNFRVPYASLGMRDFWSRWHVSLSTWFRDYLYVPLGGSRRGPWRTVANLVLTMLVSGLWHGANWTFIAWGAWHAAFLVAERLATGGPCDPARMPRPVRWIATAAVVVVGWVLFRATDIGHAAAILAEMFGSASTDGLTLLAAPTVVAAACLAVALDVLEASGTRLAAATRTFLRRAGWASIAAVSAAIVACVLLRGPGDAFIYFQF